MESENPETRLLRAKNQIENTAMNLAGVLRIGGIGQFLACRAIRSIAVRPHLVRGCSLFYSFGSGIFFIDERIYASRIHGHRLF